MLQSFSAVSFRCFKNLTIDSMARVNLIAGRNNVGKTALLEAIRLHCDASDSLLPTIINEWRGVDEPANAFGESWAWLFFDKDPANPAQLTSEDDKGKRHTVVFQLTDIATAKAGMPGFPPAPDSFPGQGWHANAPCLAIKSDVPAGERIVWVIGPNGEAWYTAAEAWRIACEFVGSGLPSADTDVRHFSALENAKRLGELIPSLQILEPRLERLSLTVLGNKPVIRGDVKGLSTLVPIHLIGEGVRRLLSILIAVFNSAAGIVLIDEIENGLHYSVMKDVWKAIAHAARKMNVQVFATTHSWECIQSAHHAFKESGPYEFRYYRLDRGEGDVSVKTMDERMLDAVERTDLEVR